MNYINLPPGRNRGLAYANYIYERYFDRSRSRESTLYFYNPLIQRRINNTLSNLQDVKIGVTLKNLLQKTKVTLHNNFECKICVICQLDINIYDIIRTINCSHHFHINCIDTWFLENKKCPICRFEI